MERLNNGYYLNVGNHMDAGIFIRSMEEQVRRIKFQLTEVDDPSFFQYDMDKNTLLENAKIWFLRTIQNTDLTVTEMEMSSTDYLSNVALETERTPPFRPRYPSLIWMISSLKKEQIESIFGIQFADKLIRISATDVMPRGSFS